MSEWMRLTDLMQPQLLALEVRHQPCEFVVEQQLTLSLELSHIHSVETLVVHGPRPSLHDIILGLFVAFRGIDNGLFSLIPCV